MFECCVPECSSHCLIIHIWLVLVFAPKSGHCFWVDQLEDPCMGIGPFDVPGADLSILQQLHQELPQVQCVSPWSTNTGNMERKGERVSKKEKLYLEKPCQKNDK